MELKRAPPICRSVFTSESQRSCRFCVISTRTGQNNQQHIAVAPAHDVVASYSILSRRLQVPRSEKTFALLRFVVSRCQAALRDHVMIAFMTHRGREVPNPHPPHIHTYIYRLKHESPFMKATFQRKDKRK